jgi:phospholipase/carboxylesterase
MNFNTQNEEEGTIVLLHGYGANGANLSPLASEWKQYFKNWNFYAPDGLIKLTLGHAWFHLDNDNWADGIKKAADHLHNEFANYKKKLIFVGFSQGGFLAAHLGIYSKLQNIKGCICFSAGLIPMAQMEKETPIYFVHGSEDNIILPQWFEKTIEYANEKNLNITGNMIDNMEHEINDKALAHATVQLNVWIKNEHLIQ